LEGRRLADISDMNRAGFFHCCLVGQLLAASTALCASDMVMGPEFPIVTVLLVACLPALVTVPLFVARFFYDLVRLASGAGPSTATRWWACVTGVSLIPWVILVPWMLAGLASKAS